MPIAQLASRLSPRGWALAGGTFLAAVLLIYLFVHLVSAPSYSTLQTGLEPAQTGKLTSALDQHGISYRLQNNGTALAVQSNQTAQARIVLAGAGLLGNSQPDFSLFNKQSLGESNFQQQVTYQRALQGQLAETIDNIQGVSGAQVELVLPSAQSQLFAEDQAPASAAVLLSGSTAVDPGAVRGIAQLVASSVPGLKLDKVTITDGSGRLLWPSQDSAAGSGASKQDAQARYDQSMDATLDAMLAQTLGPGKAQVQVYADMNVNQTTQESLTYGKTGVPLSRSTDTESLAGSGGGGGGVTGAASIPAYAQAGAGKSKYKHEVENATLGVDKTVTHSTIAPGTINAQHVSVLLDRSVPASSVAAVRAAVTNAAGIQPARGDTLAIGQMAFAKPLGAGGGPEAGILGYVKYALIGIASVAFLFFTTRTLRRREEQPIDHEPAWLRELELPMRLTELERESTKPQHALSSGAGDSAGPRRRVEDLAASNPERVAQQLRTWMQED